MAVNNQTRTSILASLAYHDVLDMPLTAWGVYSLAIHSERMSNTSFDPELRTEGQYLISNAEGLPDTKYKIQNTKYSDLLTELEHLTSTGVLGEKNGFYFLKGREGLYEQRIERMKIAEEKWHGVERVLKWYRAMPFVRAVFLSGSVALGNAKEASDVDVLVVAQAGRIWTARFFLLMLTLLCGKLRSARLSKKTSGKICLNHFITTETLAMRAQGLYNAATYVRLVPLFGAVWLEKFYEANSWIFEYFPNASREIMHRKSFNAPQPPLNLRGGEGELRSLTQRFLELSLQGIIGNSLEKALSWIQHIFIRRNALSNSKDGRIVASHEELAFHPESPERAVLEQFQQKLTSVSPDSLL